MDFDVMHGDSAHPVQTHSCKICPSLVIYDSPLNCGIACCDPVDYPGDLGWWFIYYPCIPAFDENMVQPHSKFEAPPSWLYVDGEYTVTVKIGQIISEKEDTVLTIILENEASPLEAPRGGALPLLENRAECHSGMTSGQITAGECLTIRTTVTRMCNPESSGGDSCASSASTLITLFSNPQDHYGNVLTDPCSLCLRQVDLIAINAALTAQSKLKISDMAIACPSMHGLPTLVQGSVIPGEFHARLRLRNWVGQESTETFTFTKNTPPPNLGRGPLGNEFPKPAVFIQGQDYKVITADQELRMDATASPITCFPVASSSLYFRWFLECVAGTCKLQEPKCVPSTTVTCTTARTKATTIMYWNVQLKGMVASIQRPSIIIPGNNLKAGATYKLTCIATQ
ncbi:hypothetical protein T484DRAFT_1841571, partial [Baffinella frigidus]